MNKNIKYLAFFSVLVVFAFFSNSALATGSACGVSSEGICKNACDPFDEIYVGDFGTKSGSICPTSPEGVSEQCCIPTKCESNTIGFGSCESGSSCDYGYVGINTSDCAPPNLCCVLPKTPGMQVGDEVESPLLNTIEKTDIFTGGQEGSGDDDSMIFGLVPCNGPDCSLCDIFVLIKNLINFFTQLVFALATGFIVWGSIEIMIAGGDEKRVSSGRERITISIYGIALALSAWLLIGTVLQILSDSPSVLPWNKIECSSKPIVLPKVTNPGTDNACTSKGGTCQNKQNVACENGTYEAGLCLSPKYVNDKNVQCCVPNTTTPKIEMTSCSSNPNYECTTSECPGFEMVGKICPATSFGQLQKCCPK